MNDNSAYEKEILKNIKDIEIALRYYIDKNKELESGLEYYKNAYENRVDEFIQRNKDLEQIEKEHKKENGKLREELSQYKRIDKLVSNITPEEVDTAIKKASEQFIEVSKVEKELIQLNKDEKKELKGIKGQDRYFVKQQYAAKREILEKVLKMKGR
ncbi:hypothetical protein [Faecalibacillus faecis]|uniref:hypothetical protein n=1 Tax=Faecalibacillus faecis TaxID=1982628 RepID=UPI00386D0135